MVKTQKCNRAICQNQQLMQTPMHQHPILKGDSLHRRALLHTAARLAGLAAVQLHPAAASAADAPHASGVPGSRAQRIQDAYDGFAGSYDDLDDGLPARVLGLPALRRELLSRASGRVLVRSVWAGPPGLDRGALQTHEPAGSPVRYGCASEACMWSHAGDGSGHGPEPALYDTSRVTSVTCRGHFRRHAAAGALPSSPVNIVHWETVGP